MDGAEAELGRAADLVRAGRYRDALALYQRLAERSTRYEVLVGLARAHEYLGDLDSAIDWYERTQALYPGYARPFSRQAMICARRLFGAPPSTDRADAGPGRIGMTSIGQNGRFGNQIFQYGFLRLLASLRGLRLELPDWLGRDLFNADEPLPGPALPQQKEDPDRLIAALQGRADICDIDLWGYCQYPTGVLAPWRQQWQTGLSWRPAVAEMLSSHVNNVTSSDENLVAIHIRRGDFGGDYFWTAPTEWYLCWLEKLWPRLDRPRLYVASDDPAVVADFSAYRPLTASDLPPLPSGLGFLLDFECLRRAEYLAASNSSFSIAASLLNKGLREAYRPSRVAQALLQFDPWDSPVLIR